MDRGPWGARPWLKALWKRGINHNTDSNSVLLCDSVTTSSPILQNTKQFSPLDKLHSFCGSTPLHSRFCRLNTYKIKLIGQSRSISFQGRFRQQQKQTQVLHTLWPLYLGQSSCPLRRHKMTREVQCYRSGAGKSFLTDQTCGCSRCCGYNACD